MNVLMVGVDKNRIGGMWSVAETFIESIEYNNEVNLYYVATSTCGSKLRRIIKMFVGYIRIIWILLTKKINIVHIHMAEKGSVYRKGFVVRLAKAFGKIVVVQIHAGPIMSWYDTLSESNKNRVKRILNAPDQLLVLGEYWKEHLKLIVPIEKMTVLYNGVTASERNPYNENGKYILYLGLLKKTKGTYDLVDAIKKIDLLLPEDIKVYICGMDEEGKMLQYIRERGLENRIILPGWINKEKRDAFFKNTAVVVLPSYFEGLSMTVLEAMANGIPVITSNISTMPELLGEKIHLIEPGDINGLADEIIKVISNKELRQKESEIEFERIQTIFASEKIVKQTITIYNDLHRRKK